MKKLEKYFFALVILELLILLSIHFIPLQPISSYVISFVTGSIVFFISIILLTKINLDKNSILILVVAALLLRLSFLFTDPIGSDDVYRYMWDGKLQTAGINPYLYKPLDEKLNSFHSQLLPVSMNFQEMKTIYFPVSQWLFFLGYNLSGENVWGYKLLLFLFELLTLFLIYRLTDRSNKKYLLIYALCPLPILQFALDAHLDGFGLPILLLAVYFYFKDKKLLSAFFLGLSFSIKPVGIVLIPIFFLYEKGWINKIKIAVIPFITFFIQFIPYIISTNPFEAFLIYTKHWFYNGLVFNSINSVVHNNQTARMYCSILLGITLLPLYFSNKSRTDKIYFSILLLMIFSPVVHPWYITWLLIFVPFIFRWSGIWFAFASSLTSLTIFQYKTTGVWIDYWWVQLIEYIPVLILLLYEFFWNTESIKLEFRKYLFTSKIELQR